MGALESKLDNYNFDSNSDIGFGDSQENNSSKKTPEEIRKQQLDEAEQTAFQMQKQYEAEKPFYQNLTDEDNNEGAEYRKSITDFDKTLRSEGKKPKEQIQNEAGEALKRAAKKIAARGNRIKVVRFQGGKSKYKKKKFSKSNIKSVKNKKYKKSKKIKNR